jgi:hypothetical protein
MMSGSTDALDGYRHPQLPGTFATTVIDILSFFINLNSFNCCYQIDFFGGRDLLNQEVCYFFLFFMLVATHIPCFSYE